MCVADERLILHAEACRVPIVRFADNRVKLHA
jgi:hypothetical protein